MVGVASGDSSASSKLHTEFGVKVSIRQQLVDYVYAHSLGVSIPCIVVFRGVNLHMNAYMNNVSQRSDGCLAFDGGQTCPLAPAAGSGAVGFIKTPAARGW